MFANCSKYQNEVLTPVWSLASPNTGDVARKKSPRGGEIQELWNAQFTKSLHQPGVPPRRGSRWQVHLYVYELPNAVVGRILPAEVILSRCCPQKRHLRSLLPFLNRKTCRALGLLSTLWVFIQSAKRQQISAHIHRERVSTSREERCWEMASGKTFIRRSGTSPEFRIIPQESVRSVH